MIDPRRYARVMGYSHGQATGHSRRAAHRQATGGQATAMQGRFRHAADLASRELDSSVGAGFWLYEVCSINAYYVCVRKFGTADVRTRYFVLILQ